MAANPYQAGFTRDRSESRVAAMKAADAWPEGKLLVSGWRSPWGRSSVCTGRSRRKADLMAPLTNADSAPSASARRVASRVPRRLVTPRAVPRRCQMRLKSPSSLAV